MKSQKNMLALERILGEGGKLVKETDLYPCGHCDFLIEVKPFQSPSEAGGLCDGCWKVICPQCVKLMRQDGICEPSEAKLDRWEKENDTLRRWGLDPNEARRKGIIIPDF